MEETNFSSASKDFLFNLRRTGDYGPHERRITIDELAAKLSEHPKECATYVLNLKRHSATYVLIVPLFSVIEPPNPPSPSPPEYS